MQPFALVDISPLHYWQCLLFWDIHEDKKGTSMKIISGKIYLYDYFLWLV